MLAQGTPGIINPLNFAGANLCLQIQAAIAANAAANPQGLIIDARSATGIQHCTVNPFSGATVSGQLLLGATVLQTTAPLITPSVHQWQILGIGRGNNAAETGTLIQAESGFPVNGKVVRLGDGTAITFGNRIENVAIDCNSISGTVGLYSSDIQEESGASNLDITNCPAHELWINGSGNDGVTPFADNYDFHDVEGLALNASSSTTVACEFDGNTQTQGNGPHILKGLTCSGTGTKIADSFIFDGISGSAISNLNAENAVTGYLIANHAPVNDVSFNGLRGGSISGNFVHVQSVTSSGTNGNVTHNITLDDILDVSAESTATIKDDVLGATLTNFTIGTYRIGIPQPTFGSFHPGFTHITDSPFLGSQIPGLVLANASDAPSGNILKISSGFTTSTPSLTEFDDRGTPIWNIGKDPLNKFQIFDMAGQVTRLQFIPNSATFLSSETSANISFNNTVNSGTGGVIFCTGGASPSCPASVSGPGAARFTSLAVTGLVPSTNPLCVTTGGLITNVGCSTSAAAANHTNTSGGLTTANALPSTVTSMFGRTGAIVSASGDYSVEQVSGAAPSDSPIFTGKPTVPVLAGVGVASAAAGNESTTGADAKIICATGHLCDSLSGTLHLVTGPGTISATGEPAVTITMPLSRTNLPNCLVTFSANSASKPLAVVVGYPNTSTVTVTSVTALSSSTAYDISYLCGGN